MSEGRREIRRQMQAAGKLLSPTEHAGVVAQPLTADNEAILAEVWKEARREVGRTTIAVDDSAVKRASGSVDKTLR